MSALRCPFTGAPLDADAFRVRADDRDPSRGNHPRVPVQVLEREDGSRVEFWHGQRPTYLPHPQRENPRPRKDRFAERQPTVRAAERRMAGIPVDAHPDDAADIRRSHAPASVGRAQDPTTLRALGALKARLPRE